MAEYASIYHQHRQLHWAYLYRRQCRLRQEHVRVTAIVLHLFHRDRLRNLASAGNADRACPIAVVRVRPSRICVWMRVWIIPNDLDRVVWT